MNKISILICLVTLILFSLQLKGQNDTINVDTALAKVVSESDSIFQDSVGIVVDSLLSGDLKDTNKLILVFAGDIMGHDAQIEGAYDEATESYSYEPTFRYMTDFISSADVAIGNLEVTLAGPPYKGYPQFSSPDELAEAARNAGFDILVNANNHALDRGKKGFVRTLTMLDSLKFLRAGTYFDSLNRDTLYPLIFEKNSIRIALLNYTYGTNGLTIDKPCIVNRIDTAQISIDLAKAKLAQPDYIIVIPHWGNEYELTENRSQQKLAEHIFRKGADCIIGSHPHVVQPIRNLVFDGDSSTTYPVAYSMGNFVSNQRAEYKDGGIMIELQLEKTGDSVRLESFDYLPYWVWRQDHSEKKSTFYVVPVAKYEANPDDFEFTPSDEYRIKRFADDTRERLKRATESDFYSNKKAAE